MFPSYHLGEKNSQTSDKPTAPFILCFPKLQPKEVGRKKRHGIHLSAEMANHWLNEFMINQILFFKKIKHADTPTHHTKGTKTVMLSTLQPIPVNKRGVCVCVVTKSRVTLCDPMACRTPGSSSLNFPGKNTGVGRHSLLQGIFLA